jgi:hypothetical protein
LLPAATVLAPVLAPVEAAVSALAAGAEVSALLSAVAEDAVLPVLDPQPARRDEPMATVNNKAIAFFFITILHSDFWLLHFQA